MLHIERTGRFKKDLKLALRRGKKIEKLKKVVKNLAEGIALEPKFCDHRLSGSYSYARECHIEPDWLLIYTKTDETLRLERTGTHSDLFKL